MYMYTCVTPKLVHNESYNSQEHALDLVHVFVRHPSPLLKNLLYIYDVCYCSLTVQGLTEDPSTYVVMMEGAGEKAFCAGGDIRG